MFQQVDYRCRTLAYIVPKGPLPDRTSFVTPDSCNQQVGYICRPEGDNIPRHFHRPIERTLVGTTEVLLVLKGQVAVDFYDDDKKIIAERILNEGDLIIIVAGGHGFRMLSETVMLEIKQGPYPGIAEEKEIF